jgi:hypothetical protein
VDSEWGILESIELSDRVTSWWVTASSSQKLWTLSVEKRSAAPAAVSAASPQAQAFGERRAAIAPEGSQTAALRCFRRPAFATTSRGPRCSPD